MGRKKLFCTLLLLAASVLFSLHTRAQTVSPTGVSAGSGYDYSQLRPKGFQVPPVNPNAVEEGKQPNLPSACYGDEELYGVAVTGAETGPYVAQYDWKVYRTDPASGKKIFVKSIYTYGDGRIARVLWKDSTDSGIGGIYTMEVHATIGSGCVTKPYKANIIVNSPTLYIPGPLYTETYNPNNVTDAEANAQVGDPLIQEVLAACATPGVEGFRKVIAADLTKTKEELDKLPETQTYSKPGPWYFYFPEGKPRQYTNDVYYVTEQDHALKVRAIAPNQFCRFTALEVAFHRPATISLGPDTTIYDYSKLTIGVKEIPDASGKTVGLKTDSYHWTSSVPSAPWLSEAAVGFHTAKSVDVSGETGPQVIRVDVVDNNGCSSSAQVMVSTKDPEPIRIPSAFTPNGDGINDTWIIPAKDGGYDVPGLKVEDVRVYDRWGTLVWTKRGLYTTPWDGRDLNGRPMPMDSYHYEMQITFRGKTKLMYGSITIVR